MKEFDKLVSKTIKELSKAGKYIEKARHSDNQEMARIYYKMAQDEYEHFKMFHDLMPAKIKEYMGDTFRSDDKMFMALHGTMQRWAKDIKEDIDKFQI